MIPSSKLARLAPQTLEEASEWFVQFRIGDVHAQGREAFNAWLCRSPDHIEAYLQIAQTYVDVAAFKDKTPMNLQDLVARARSEANVIPIERVLSASPPASAEAQTIRPRSLRKPLVALAAGVTLIVFGIIGYFSFDALHSPDFSTQTGEQRSLSLTDSSTVALNAQSRVRVRFSDRERRVDLLAGQALFNVTKDRNRPFVVYSKGAVIRAVGTQFDVYQRKSGTTVTVLEGRVAVASNLPVRVMARSTPETPREVYVSAGEKLTLAPGANLEPEKTKPAAAVAWTQRRLLFEGTSLAEVAEDFNRYNVRPLVVRGKGLEDFRISGTYSSTDPASLLRFLKAEPGLVVEEDEKQIVVRRE